ncbi:MAG: YheU family protein [Bdellovibrionales bacterium]|nr:YheU family protein [Bdellovibrionales bacterium]
MSSEVLQQIIEEFILREGTDYGWHEFSFEEKKSHIYKQLEVEKIKIIYDPNNESITLLTKEEFNKTLLAFKQS